jgi:hypothetical protein
MNLEGYNMKICKKCFINKPLILFNKRADSKDGLSHECKECVKVRSVNYYSENEKKLRLYQKEYYKNNSDYIQDRVKKYRDSNLEKMRVYEKERRVNRKDYLNEYTKNKRKTDILFRLSCNLRSRTRKFLKNKSKHTKDIIGIEMDELKSYLGSLFSEGMNWDNYGDWHIDHIIPLSSAKDEDELFKLCHYTNLQPLFAKDNIIKSNKIYNGITKERTC